MVFAPQTAWVQVRPPPENGQGYPKDAVTTVPVVITTLTDVDVEPEQAAEGTHAQLSIPPGDTTFEFGVPVTVICVPEGYKEMHGVDTLFDAYAHEIVPNGPAVASSELVT
jgi:hypothetical protein